MAMDRGRLQKKSAPANVGREMVLAGLLLVGWVAAANADRCTPAFGRVVSVQGNVEIQAAGATWQAATLNATLCAGDMVRVHQRSRAALLLSSETTLRLDQGTVLTLVAPDDKNTTLLEQISGGLHVITRTPKAFKVKTPFVNANVEGTEFAVRVEPNDASISVFEGRVVADNPLATVTVESGEGVIARRGVGPSKGLLIRSPDAVAWTLHFPTILDRNLSPDFADASQLPALRRSIELYGNGNLDGAREALEPLADTSLSSKGLTYRAGLLLSIGRVDEARPRIEQALRLDPRNSDGYSLLAIIALVENDKDKSLELAEKAVTLDPASSSALIALSFVQQGQFKIEEALSTVRKALASDPQNALALARLAELYMSTGDFGGALEAAGEAASREPRLARAQAVFGFLSLTRADVPAAKVSFERAIELDSADPLPRLGLGLARIRGGDLVAGRFELEIATVLDPANSLLRSYLGKAYYEEMRDALASSQLQFAKGGDAADPTPWLYDAILKQSRNRPVEALEDLQVSIGLNGNRAVYRSRLLLDGDQASRTVALARIYSDVGFGRLALAAGTASIDDDPSQAGAHRLLADAYFDLSRHEIARSSELLQSQLRQPLTLTPVQLRLADDRYVILRGAGPDAAGYNEYNALFNRDSTLIQASAIGGNQSTFGDQLLASGISGRWSYSFGQLAYGTNGFRENDDFRKHLYDAFVQYQHDESLGVQVEVRRSTSTFGDTVLRFDPLLFFPDRYEVASTSSRLGARHQLNQRSEILGSLIAVASDASDKIAGDPLVTQRFRTYVAEIQHVWRDARFSLVSGGGSYSESTQTNLLGTLFNATPRATNAYAYGTLRALDGHLRLLLGASADHLKSGDDLNGSKTQVNPKLGLTWGLSNGATLRVAHFRTLKRRLFASQTLEPTEVAGFNQFFDDQNGTDATRNGVAMDYRYSDHLFMGWEASRRSLRVPQDFTSGEVFNWRERDGSAYVYWAPHPRAALSAQYIHEHFDRPLDFPGQELFISVTTRKIPLQIDLRDPSGLSVRVAVTNVRQSGSFFAASLSPDPEAGDAAFWVADASIGYRLPRRLGAVYLDVRNIFDRRFQFQETDLFAPAFARRRTVLARASLNF